MGVLRDRNTDKPFMILCPATFKFGGLQDVKDAPAKVTCQTVADGVDRATWRMHMLGQTILHEYTHWSTFYKDVMAPHVSIGDENAQGKSVYGPYQTQQLALASQAQPFQVADSYAWFASEAWFTQQCKTVTQHYDAAQSGDGKDPRCGNVLCEDGPTGS